MPALPRLEGDTQYKFGSSFEDFLELCDQLRIQFQNIFYALLKRGAVIRIDVEVGFFCLGEKLRIIHRVHESFADNLNAVFRRARR